MFWTNKEEIEEVNKSKLSDKAIETFNKNNLMDRKNIITEADKVLNFIGFMFDINFKYDFEVMKKENYINKILDKFEFIDEVTSNQMKNAKKIANEYIEKQL